MRIVSKNEVFIYPLKEGVPSILWNILGIYEKKNY